LAGVLAGSIRGVPKKERLSTEVCKVSPVDVTWRPGERQEEKKKGMDF